MSLVPEIIYMNGVKECAGVKGGMDYYANFNLMIATDYLFIIEDIIEIDIKQIDETVNVSKATALIRDIVTFENGVKVRMYFWTEAVTIEGQTEYIYKWESVLYYNGNETHLNDSTSMLFNEYALADFPKTTVLKAFFSTTFTYNSQSTGGVVENVTPADSFTFYILQPATASSGDQGIQTFDHIQPKHRYYLQHQDDATPSDQPTDLMYHAYCRYVGLNIIFRYENLNTLITQINALNPTDPVTIDDVIKTGAIDPDAPIQDDDPSKPGGGGGNYDDTSDPIDFPDLPTGGAISSGAIKAFVMGTAQLTSMMQRLWDKNIFDILTQFQKLVDAPMDALISLHCLPVTPTTTNATDVLLGNFDTGVNAPPITSQYMYVEMGTLTVQEFWGSALDYSPYTRCEISLPGIGLRELKIEDVMNATLVIKYALDVLTGDIIAFIKCGQSVLYKYKGNLRESVPITSKYNEFAANMARATAGAVAGMAAGGQAGAVLGLASAAPQVMASKTHTTRIGDIDGSSSLMDDFVPYLIIHRPYQSLAENFSAFKGYPANLSRKLSSLKGYTEVEYIHLTGIDGATDTELTEIESLLKSGVII